MALHLYILEYIVCIYIYFHDRSALWSRSPVSVRFLNLSMPDSVCFSFQFCLAIRNKNHDPEFDSILYSGGRGEGGGIIEINQIATRTIYKNAPPKNVFIVYPSGSELL